MTENVTGQRPAGAVYCGRAFTPAELGVIRRLAQSLPTRRAIADAVCDTLGWRRADGRRKDMTARVALNRMAADGLITLPAPRNGNGNGRHPRHAPGQQLALPAAGSTDHRRPRRPAAAAAGARRQPRRIGPLQPADARPPLPRLHPAGRRPAPLPRPG